MEIQRPKSKQPMPENAKLVFKGKLFDVYQWEQEMFDGTKAIFEQVKRPDTVVVFPVLPNGKIILTEQEQPGKEPFLGAIGGRVDEGESIFDALKREMLEEGGCTAEEHELWIAKYPVVKMDWVVYVFIAKNVKKISEPNPDAGEKIKLKEITFDELINIATDKNIYFAEQEIVEHFLEAKYNPIKKEELKKIFNIKK